MLTGVKRILIGLCLAGGLAFPVTAQQTLPCDSFAKNGDGDWIATRDVTVPGPNGPIEVKEGNAANSDLQDRLDSLCR